MRANQVKPVVLLQSAISHTVEARIAVTWVARIRGR
jgi:hypothetical protein